MPAVTTLQLMNRAQNAANMHDGFVDPDMWMTWATEELADLEGMIARWGYVLREDFVDLTATGAISYTPTLTGLYPGILAIVAVYQVHTDGRLRRIPSGDPGTRARQTTPNHKGDAREFYARAVGDNIEISFYPAPPSGTYRVFFIPHPPQLVLSGAVAGTSATSVNFPLSWERWIYLRMALKGRLREETDTSAIDRELSRAESAIESAVYSRLLGQVPAVRNVDDVERGWIDRVTWPPVSQWIFL